MRDIDTAVVDSLKVLDPNRPIREAEVVGLDGPGPLYPLKADIAVMLHHVSFGPQTDMAFEMAARQKLVIGPQIARETVTY